MRCLYKHVIIKNKTNNTYVYFIRKTKLTLKEKIVNKLKPFNWCTWSQEYSGIENSLQTIQNTENTGAALCPRCSSSSLLRTSIPKTSA